MSDDQGPHRPEPGSEFTVIVTEGEGLCSGPAGVTTCNENGVTTTRDFLYVDHLTDDEQERP